MKNTDFSDENKLMYENNADDISHIQHPEYVVKGDVDELIFPDDEPYYISQR